MKIHRFWISKFKNLRNCEVIFDKPYLVNAVIGGNGSGKSNLVEAILQVLLDIYLNANPIFDFYFEYETQNRRVELSNMDGQLKVVVDGQAMSGRRFAARLRDGDAQVFYPETTFAYYSGDCKRVLSLINRYSRSFRLTVQKPGKDNLRPLFVLSTNHKARLILLALIVHRHTDFLRRIGVVGAQNIKIELQSPDGFDPNEHEPILWGTTGKIGKNIAALNDTALEMDRERRLFQSPNEIAKSGSSMREYRTYTFPDSFGPADASDLRRRLETGHDNLYLALEHLAARGILKSVNYKVIGEDTQVPFDFDQLSEGEKQLIAVIGAIRLANQDHNLILLDEPDTHLNPQWSWEYPELLEAAFDTSQLKNSTVLMATHDPVVISGLERHQVFLADGSRDRSEFNHPYRHPRGQGIANILCSSEFFGLPSSLDKKTQLLMDERLRLSMQEVLEDEDKHELKELNEKLEFLQPGISERDPDYADFLRSRKSSTRGDE